MRLGSAVGSCDQSDVHLDHDRRAGAEHHAETVEIGTPEALLGRAVADLDARVGAGELVGEASRPVR